VLVRIAALYAIEDEIRGGSPDERTDIRQARSKPLVDKLETWLNEQLARVSKGSEIAKEIRYGLNHWTGLCRFLDDGRIEIDSNTVERSMRPIALSRKNALFAGSDEGAQNWAAIASLIETCKLNAVNPHAWLSDTLTKLVNRWPASRIDELMPWAFPGANVNGDVTPLTAALARRANIPPITIHGLRHTHITDLLRAGVHPKVVSERAGHATPAFTLQRYAHASPDMQRDAADQVQRLVGKLVGR